MRSFELEKEQHVHRILYKFDTYKSWFTEEELITANDIDLCDLIGFCLDVQESLEAIIKYRQAERMQP